MRFQNLKRYLKDPVWTARRVAYSVYEFRHSEEPWIAQGAIRFCESELKPSMKGFEWGSGRSTRWFSTHLASLISIEHDFGWYDRIRQSLAKSGRTNVDYRYVPLDHDAKEPTVAIYPRTPSYVAAIGGCSDGALDLTIVDGHYRQACILAAIPKLKPGGFLLVDNTNWLPLEKWVVPSDWPIVHQSENVMTQTTIWQKPKTYGENFEVELS